jgi:cytochrome c553
MRLGKGRRALLAALFIPLSGLAQGGPEQCAACHGAGGNSTTQGIPSIAGQPKLFIENQLVLFREELRRSAAMLPVVKGMKDGEIVRLAQHFSKLPAQRTTIGSLDEGLFSKGRELAKKLRCGVCHLADFRGQNQVPRIAAQREEYLEAEMRAYRDNTRSGGDTIMAATLYGVPDADIRALAHFLSRSP